jgi:DNA binding protein with HTH domain
MAVRPRPARVDGAKQTTLPPGTPFPSLGNGYSPPRLGQLTGVKRTNRLLMVSLRLRLPDRNWFGPFTRLHTHAIIEVLRIGEAGSDTSVADLWINGQPPGVWGNEISAYPGVESVDALSELGRGTLYRVTMKTPPIVSLYRRLRLPLPLPLRMQSGFVRWEVVARVKEFDQVLEFARNFGLEPRVVSIRRRPLQDHLPLLSSKQQTLLNQTMDAGYFAVPRAITLTALARKLNRSKSGISESIALIEKKLLESAFGSRGPLSESDLSRDGA